MSSGGLIKKGLPFFVLVIGGALGLVQFSKVRYKYKTQTFTRADAEEVGIKMKKPEEVSMDSEYNKMQKLDIDSWENIRGPRPWEDNNPSTQEMQRRLEAKQRKAQPL